MKTVEKTKVHLDNLETVLFNLLRFPPVKSGWMELINAEARQAAADIERAIRLEDNQNRKAIMEAIEMRKKGKVTVDQWMKKSPNS